MWIGRSTGAQLLEGVTVKFKSGFEATNHILSHLCCGIDNIEMLSKSTLGMSKGWKIVVNSVEKPNKWLLTFRNVPVAFGENSYSGLSFVCYANDVRAVDIIESEIFAHFEARRVSDERKRKNIDLEMASAANAVVLGGGGNASW